jgi:hypothetical protein
MFPKPWCLALVFVLFAVLPGRTEIVKGIIGIKGAEMN